MSLGCFFIQVRQFIITASLLGLFSNNITIGSRSRCRKIPTAALANQIAGMARIQPAHERKKNPFYHPCKFCLQVSQSISACLVWVIYFGSDRGGGNVWGKIESTLRCMFFRSSDCRGLFDYVTVTPSSKKTVIAEASIRAMVRHMKRPLRIVNVPENESEAHVNGGAQNNRKKRRRCGICEPA